MLKTVNFYLVTTDHLCDKIWFRDEEDFKVAMNLVAVVAASSTALVLSFILMSNHVHFLLSGSEGEASAFIDKFKQLYGKYYRRKYGIPKILRGNAVDIRPVGEENESLERALAYVQMNCVAANICTNPGQYPWGCGDVFFSQRRNEGFLLGSLSQRAQARLLHSREFLPKDYRVLGQGYVDPASYVPVSFVESVFHTPRRYNYFLMNSSKARARMEARSLPSFRDQVIISSIEDLCHSLFRKNEIGSLEEAEKAELVRQLRWRFGSDIPQIARLTGITYADIARMLD